jgi:hypothetical protein
MMNIVFRSIKIISSKRKEEFIILYPVHSKTSNSAIIPMIFFILFSKNRLEITPVKESNIPPKKKLPSKISLLIRNTVKIRR